MWMRCWAALDRLIAKKRDLKQAAMQQLLTGRTACPASTASGRLGLAISVTLIPW